MAKEKSDTKNLNNSLKRLSEITEWFDNQEEIDVEEGLKKVKEAAELIKVSKERLKTIENEFEEMKIYCNTYDTYVLNYESINLNIPCDVIEQGQEVVVNYSINEFIKGVYYKKYDCAFWDCFAEDTVPFFLVSAKAQDYWYSKFNYMLMVLAVLSILGFLLARRKSNFFILTSALIIIAALPFYKLGWLISLLGDTAEGLLSVFFSKGFSVFIRAIIFGVILLVIGFVLKLFKVGFKIQTIFAKKEQEAIQKENVKKEVKEELKKEGQRPKIVNKEVKKPLVKKK